MPSRKKMRKKNEERRRTGDTPLTAEEKTRYKSRARRQAECMNLSEQLVAHLDKEHPAHRQFLFDCTIWCNETRPRLIERSAPVPERGRILSQSLIPEAGIANKISLVAAPSAFEEEEESMDAGEEPVN